MTPTSSITSINLIVFDSNLLSFFTLSVIRSISQRFIVIVIVVIVGGAVLSP
jgi:hypothetical protein